MSTHQLSRDLEGIRTQVVLQIFADRTFVLVTQLGKVGTLIQASIPDTTPLIPLSASEPSFQNQRHLPAPLSTIHLTPLLGHAPSEYKQTLHSLYAAQIATIVWMHNASNVLEYSPTGVVVGLALRQSDSPDDKEVVIQQDKLVFHGVMCMIYDLLIDK